MRQVDTKRNRGYRIAGTIVVLTAICAAIFIPELDKQKEIPKPRLHARTQNSDQVNIPVNIGNDTTTQVASSTSEKGVKLLFKGVKTDLSPSDKLQIYKSLGFYLSNSQTRFVIDKEQEDAYSAFDARVYVTDMNKDGVDEVFVSYGNSITSGSAGSSVALFIKNGKNEYKSNLDFPGCIGGVLPTKNEGYNDLIIGCPGMDIPVWSWNGKEYVFSKRIQPEKIKSIRATSFEDFVR